MSLPYTYQRIMDAARTLNECIHDVLAAEGEGSALGERRCKALDAAAMQAGVAAWIAHERRDEIMPEAADETIIRKGAPTP